MIGRRLHGDAACAGLAFGFALLGHFVSSGGVVPQVNHPHTQMERHKLCWRRVTATFPPGLPPGIVLDAGWTGILAGDR